jgi:hypothetical protein
MEVIKLQCVNAFKTFYHAFLHLLRCGTQVLKAVSTKGKCHTNTISVHGYILPQGDSRRQPADAYRPHRDKKIELNMWQHRSRGRCLILRFNVGAVRPHVATGPRLLPRREVCTKHALISFLTYVRAL